MAIRMVEMMKLVEERRNGAVVIPTMTGSRGWNQVSRLIERDWSIGGAMGKASSAALGLALARPKVKFIVFDGDGSLEMNLGTLVTIANKAPKNLYHFVLENGVYAITGGQPIPAAGRVSFAGLARAAGYRAAYEFDDLEELATQIDEVLGQEGPVFVTVKVEPEIENEPIGRRQRAGTGRRMPQVIAELKQSLSAKP